MTSFARRTPLVWAGLGKLSLFAAVYPLQLTRIPKTFPIDTLSIPFQEEVTLPYNSSLAASYRSSFNANCKGEKMLLLDFLRQVSLGCF